MDQLLKNLGTVLNGPINGLSNEGDDGGGGDQLDGGGTEIQDVDEVMQVLECQMSAQQEQDEKRGVGERLAKCQEKQQYLESRYRRLQTRINKLRAKKLGCHAAEVLTSVTNSCEKRRTKLETAEEGKVVEKVEEVKAECKVPKKVKVRRYNKQRTDEMLGQVHAHVRHVAAALDPDATESSSGGESADEQDKFNPAALKYAPIEDRARYRWLKGRGELAARWVWLQAQVSDLEYKIRQQNELYARHRAAKGAVLLGEEVISWPAHAKVPANATPSTEVPLDFRPVTKVYQRSQKSLTGGVNEKQDASKKDETSEDESTMTACRVRPVKRVRRRRLVDTYGMHYNNRKAAKLSTVSCSCNHPDQWCVICLGRRSHTLQVDNTTQTRSESVALLDHSYHTVLSKSADVPLHLTLMESVTTRRWLSRSSQPVQGTTHLPTILTIGKSERKKYIVRKRDGKEEGKRKYVKKKDKDGNITKVKIKKEVKVEGKGDAVEENDISVKAGEEVKVKEEVKVGKEVKEIRDRNSLTEQMKRKRKSNYDIDHIVIPYSMASATRVEKIKYKEIPTPTWREIELPPLTKKGKKVKPPKPSSEDSDFEDTSELAFRLRHAKAEDEEQIRWCTPLGRVHGGQRKWDRVGDRRGRRLDSCRTETSSGANTPDPLSPGTLDRVEDIVVATRPSTPTIEGHSGEATPVMEKVNPVALGLHSRRRSHTRSRDRNLSEASQQSQESATTSRSVSPWTEAEEQMVVPYEPRVFPLSDDEYGKMMAQETPMAPPHPVAGPSLESSTVSAATSRTNSRASSVLEEDEGDPDWENEAEYEEPDDDPEYDPKRDEFPDRLNR